MARRPSQGTSRRPDMSGSGIGSRLRGQLGTAAGKGFFVFSLLLLALGLVISANDFRTSYLMIGQDFASKVHDQMGKGIAIALSFLPQVAQIWWGYAFAMDGGFRRDGISMHPVMLSIFGTSFLIDWYFDTRWLTQNSVFNFGKSSAIVLGINFILSEALVSFCGAIVIATIMNRGSNRARAASASGPARASMGGAPPPVVTG